jgi:hypothetical protein
VPSVAVVFVDPGGDAVSGRALVGADTNLVDQLRGEPGAGQRAPGALLLFLYLGVEL